MQQKLTLAGALIHDPKLLILDEPLTGLDAAAARKVKDFLADLVKSGLTVLFTTHILEVAERMASRIGLIRAGRLIAEGSLDELRSRYGNADDTLEDLFLSATGDERLSNGGYLQGTYTWGKTTFGANYGISRLNKADGDTDDSLIEKNSKYTVGVYHKLLANLTLTSEFTAAESKSHAGEKIKTSNYNVGFFISF